MRRNVQSLAFGEVGFKHKAQPRFFALTLIHFDWGHHKSAASPHSTVPIACVGGAIMREKGMGYPLSFSFANLVHHPPLSKAATYHIFGTW